MAGLLAASVLRRHKPVIHEAQSSLPNNHAALLRFRSDAVAKATGIPFRRVEVQKAISYQGQILSSGSLALNNMYSQKVSGKISDRSIINLKAGERFIAPPDFIAQMAGTADIQYNSGLTKEELLARTPDSDPVISTIPAPVMMGLADWEERVDFQWRTIWAVTAEISDCDVYQTVYYPDPNVNYYRASLTGNLLTLEYSENPVFIEKDCADVMAGLGVGCSITDIAVKEQKYGKLTPLADPGACRKFILYLTDRYRVYSLGRFATWRQLLLDSVVNDIEVIERLINYRDGYQRALLK
jgi:hypothetical protein